MASQEIPYWSWIERNSWYEISWRVLPIILLKTDSRISISFAKRLHKTSSSLSETEESKGRIICPSSCKAVKRFRSDGKFLFRTITGYLSLTIELKPSKESGASISITLMPWFSSKSITFTIPSLPIFHKLRKSRAAFFTWAGVEILFLNGEANTTTTLQISSIVI